MIPASKEEKVELLGFHVVRVCARERLHSSFWNKFPLLTKFPICRWTQPKTM